MLLTLAGQVKVSVVMVARVVDKEPRVTPVFLEQLVLAILPQQRHHKETTAGRTERFTQPHSQAAVAAGHRQSATTQPAQLSLVAVVQERQIVTQAQRSLMRVVEAALHTTRAAQQEQVEQVAVVLAGWAVQARLEQLILAVAVAHLLTVLRVVQAVRESLLFATQTPLR